jgi:hypothetical protein
MSGLQSATIIEGSTNSERFKVANSCGGSDDHPGAGDVCTPAKIKILAVKGHVTIEATDRGEQISTHERYGAGDVEHISHGIVLFLIEIAAFHVRRGMAVSIRAHPNGDQPFRIAPFDEFGTDDSRVRSKCLLNEEANDVGFKANIVVTEEIERCTLNGDEHLVRRGPKTRVGLKTTQMSVREN